MASRARTTVFTVVATLAVVTVAALLLPRVVEVDLAVGDLVLRTQVGRSHPFPADGAVAERIAVPSSEAGRRPRGVVLVIGDGMGLGMVSSAAHILHGPDAGLALETAPVVGLMRTVAANDLVTDSAASASAMATGFKVDRRVLAIRPDGNRPRSLREAARAAGLAFGVVTTAALVDATPAAFLARSTYRYDSGDILRQVREAEAEVLVGGDGTTSRKVYRDPLYRELLGRAEETAVPRTVVRSADELWEAEPPVIALLPPRGRRSDQYGPPVGDTAAYAYDAVSRDPDGFLLLVECEATDSFGHDNAIAAVVAAVREIDDATRALLARAAATDDVLVVVTADHDTGALSIVDGEDGVAEVRWASHEHTGQWVPVFAWGPGAERFGGVFDNTVLGVRIAELLGLEGLPTERGQDAESKADPS